MFVCMRNSRIPYSTAVEVFGWTRGNMDLFSPRFSIVWENEILSFFVELVGLVGGFLVNFL